MRQRVISQFIKPESLGEILSLLLDREQARVGRPPSMEDVALVANELISYFGFEDRVAYAVGKEESDSFFYEIEPQ